MGPKKQKISYSDLQNEDYEKLKKQFKALYIAINELLLELGVYGEMSITTETGYIMAIMDALYDIDEGFYDTDKVFDGGAG